MSILPSDPVWKRDYSGSVRRLVRDGVDTPLASLFAHVARTVPPDADGADRARSATEAFLFNRLETLSETKGRFAVNATLPIAFDGMASLEVDLLCTDARVAVELDGAQHLADPVAYRRDRRKDLLLQENGYVVLRFLAEDVGKELDTVLDTILRALSHRASSVATPLLLFRRGAECDAAVRGPAVACSVDRSGRTTPDVRDAPGHVLELAAEHLVSSSWTIPRHRPHPLAPLHRLQTRPVHPNPGPIPQSPARLDRIDGERSGARKSPR